MTNPARPPLLSLAAGSSHEAMKASRPMRWWYESLADYMISNPSATQAEIAAHLGRAESTISLVINTDSFKAYFRQRRNVHAEQLDATVRQKLFKVADSSLDHLLTVLDKKRDNIPIEMLQRTADSALKNLGYGVAAPATTNVNVNTNPQTVNVAVSLEDLEAAREALRRNQLSTPTAVPSTVDVGETLNNDTPDEVVDEVAPLEGDK